MKNEILKKIKEYKSDNINIIFFKNIKSISEIIEIIDENYKIKNLGVWRSIVKEKDTTSNLHNYFIQFYENGTIYFYKILDKIEGWKYIEENNYSYRIININNYIEKYKRKKLKN